MEYGILYARKQFLQGLTIPEIAFSTASGAISVRLLFIEFFLLYTVRLRKTYFVTKNIYISLLIVLLTEWIAGLKYFGQKCTASGLAVSKLT